MSPTAIVIARGGLGNQLFQLAAGFYVHKKYKFKLRVIKLKNPHLSGSNINEVAPEIMLTNSFSEKNIISYIIGKCLYNFLKIIKKIFNVNYVDLNSQVGHIDLSKLSEYKVLILFNYYQSYKIANSVRIEMQNLIQSGVKNKFGISYGNNIHAKSAIIHMRRGDYYSNKNTIGVLSDDYFFQIIKEMLSQNVNEIYIMSDDEISIKNFGIPKEVKIQFVGADFNDFERIIFISKFKFIAISNSTLSWWGAFLAGRDAKVYAPSQWFKGIDEPLDLIPDYWIRASSKWVD